MRKLLFSMLIIALYAQSAYSQAPDSQSPSLPQIFKGAAGGLLGGLLGHQVGGGNGRTAATAVAAATGTVIASGCRVSSGTVLGGLVGGIFGSQVGGGRGKDVMAGVGASVGSLIGSDCSPVGKASLPEPLSLPPITINGLRVTPMTGFPLEAFGGLPPITSTQDLAAAGKTVRQLSSLANDAYTQGDTETALVAMYWAKRISSTTLGIISASVQTLSSSKAGKATIPAKGLAILPAFNQYNAVDTTALLDDLGAAERTLARINLSQGISITDAGGLSGIINALQAFKNVKAPGQQTQQVAQAQPQPQMNGTAPQIQEELQGFPSNQVLKLPNGTMVLKTGDALAVFNPSNSPATLPLDQLDFVPRTPQPSADRQAAGRLLSTITNNERNWVFNTYARQVTKFSTVFRAPNELADIKNRRIAAYFNDVGQVTPYPEPGRSAYRSNTPFRIAMNLLDATDRMPQFMQFRDSCMSLNYGTNTSVLGTYSTLERKSCFTGTYDNPTVVKAKTFYLGEDGQVVQTMDSLMDDRNVVAAMNQALADGQAVSDLVSFVPGVGNLENAAQCAGSYTTAQYGNVRRVMGANAFAKAKLSGWQAPDQSDWDLNRVANCLGAIPLASDVISGAKAAAKYASGPRVLAALSGPRLEVIERVSKAFDSPRSLSEYVAGVKNVEELVPGNANAASLVKKVYDGLMTGQNMQQTASSAWYFGDQLANAH